MTTVDEYPTATTNRERALVVGASGFLGSAVADRLSAAGTDVVGAACDGTVPNSCVDAVRYDFWADDLEAVLGAHDPGTVVFAAAVEGGDDGPRHAFERAVRRFVDGCADRRVVYVSSDAVFDGERGWYDETDAANPTTAYGRRTVALEDAIAKGRREFCVVRPSYLYGFRNGELDPRLARTRERVRAGESVEYFENAYRSPICVDDAAAIIASAVRRGTTGTVHAAAPRTSIYEFHCEAMHALDEPASPIVPEPVPPDAGYPLDTSLSSVRLDELVGFEPASVTRALESIS